MLQQQRDSSTLLNFGVATSGKIKLEADEDFFRISVTKGQKYTVSINNIDTFEPEYEYNNIQMDVKDFNGLDVNYSRTRSGLEHSMTFMADATGDYYFRISNLFLSGPDDNPYTIKVDEYYGADDHSDSRNNSATLLNLGITTPGEIEINGDKDVFRIDVTAGQKYKLSLNNLSDNEWVLGDVYKGNEEVAIFTKDFNGNTVWQAYMLVFRASDLSSVFEPQVTGTHYFEVDNSTKHNGVMNEVNTYTILVDEYSKPDDHSNNKNNSATLLNLGTATSGVIEMNGDQDVFRIDVTAGQKYTISLNNFNDFGWIRNDNDDPETMLLNSGKYEGIVFEVTDINDDKILRGGGNPEIIDTTTFEAVVTGTHYFNVENMNFITKKGNTYSIQVDEFNGTPTDSALVNNKSTDSALVNNKPTGSVLMTGNATEGSLLTADASELVDEDGLGVFSYTWLRDGLAFGPSGTTYLLTPTDVGAQISVAVDYTDGGGTKEQLLSLAVMPQIRNLEIIGTAGPDDLKGGSGIDTVVYSGNQTSYTLTLSPTGTTITDRRADGTGTDTLTSIEKLAFTDSTLDMNAFTGLTQLSSDQFKSLAEMYVAYFNRAPDAEGLFFWADQLAESLNMNEIAERFFDQAETRAIYTDPSNTDAFVTAVYANVLGRTPDEGGSTFWKARLAEGDVTQGAFVLTIIEAAKNVAGSSDAAYLSDKTDVGIYYSAIKGLSDGTDGRQVMAAFGDQETSNKLGAKTAIDGHYADATTGAEGEFLFNVVGVVSNPFAEFV